MGLKLKIPKEILLGLILSGSCTKDFDPRQQSYPLIQTTAVTDIDGSGAQFNAHVIKVGTSPVVDFGFKYIERPDSLFKSVLDTFSVSMAGEFGSNFSMKVNHNLNTYVKYDVMAYATTANETVIGNPVIFKSASTSPIQIHSFSPSHVLDGDTVTIFGENFNRYNSDYVFIGDKLLREVLRFDNNSVTVVMPAVFQAGPVNVTVDAFYSRTNSDQLVVINPFITSVSPSHGPVGIPLTLKGRFSSTLNYNKIFFNGIAGIVAGGGRDQITVYVPPGLSGTVSLTISVNGKTMTLADTFLAE